MLPKYIENDPEEISSILIRRESCNYFNNTCHIHPDLEMNLILKSTGIRFVGDNIKGFSENDLVLLGPNVPHHWINDKTYYRHDNELNAEAIVVRFPELFMGKGQFVLPELQGVKQLFKQARRGLLITGDGKMRIVSSIVKMMNYQGMERLIIFLGILNAIINTCELTYLSSEGFMSSLNEKNEKRLSNVYSFITNNFREKITLAEIAKKANMNPSAFSRFFTQHTKRSVTGFIQDLRLGYSCTLLIEGDQNISKIIHESGFQNQAYFNKLFIREKGMTPKSYRQKHSLSI